MRRTSPNRRSVLKASLAITSMGMGTGLTSASKKTTLQEELERIYGRHGDPVSFEMEKTPGSGGKPGNAAYDVQLDLAENETPLRLKVIPRGSSGWDQFVVFPGNQEFEISGRYEYTPSQEMVDKKKDQIEQLRQQARESMESAWEESE